MPVLFTRIEHAARAAGSAVSDWRRMRVACLSSAAAPNRKCDDNRGNDHDESNDTRERTEKKEARARENARCRTEDTG